MLRFSAGVSLCFTVLGVLGACSSESTDDGKDGSGATAGAGSGGTSSSAAGTSSGGASSGSGAAGVGGGRAGSTGVGGSSGGTTGSCTPGEVTCVDELTAAACDEATGMTVTLNCVDELKAIGINSTGCVTDATGSGCDGEPADPTCADGATVFAICNQLTQEQFFNVYINCFLDAEGAQADVQCVAPFLAASGQEADCDGAAAACFPDTGAGGAGGAGG